MTTDASTGQEGGAARPHLRIVSGNPTPEEIAIVTAVLAAAGGEEQPVEATRPLWQKPVMRRPLAYGAGGWRASALRGL